MHFLNSEERRAARRKRREEARAAKKAERNKDCTIENVASLENLYRAAKESSRGVKWKGSVQRYLIRILRNIVKARRDVLEGNDISRGFIRFDLWERGKLRHISSVHFSERVIQKSLSQNALVPAIAPTLINDNSANIKGKGTDFAIMRLKRQLADHYRKHGAEGYILQIDFSDYFANISHEGVKRLVERYLTDPDVIALEFAQIDAQGEVGLGLGSEPNQILAVAYPTTIDHFVTECCEVEAYGRYMDDSYAIHTSKEHLQVVLGAVEVKCSQLGITLNTKKTRIVKLSRGFTFLKKKFSYTETGRILVRPCRASITRERRKLKKLAALYRKGEITLEQAERSYQSWRGSMLRLDAYRTVRSMDSLFHDLFYGQNCCVGGGVSQQTGSD